MTPRVGQKCETKVRVKVHAATQEDKTEKAPQPRQGRQKEGGGKEIGGGGEVPRVIAYQAVGSDSCRGGTIKRGASPKETLADCGRQGPQKGVSKGWPIEEAPEVLARVSIPLQDLPVPEEH